MTSEPLRILVVCTANMCRSPMLEAMLRRAAGEKGMTVEVSSAGFLYDGEHVSPTVAEVMRERGFDPDSHLSRIIDSEVVNDADLVLTMERSHARRLILSNPEFGSRIHTVGGFAASLERLVPPPASGESAREIIERVAESRDEVDLLGTGSDDVADPHGRHRRIHRSTADLLESLAESILVGLNPV